MAVRDLTGTTWMLKEYLTFTSFESNMTFNIIGSMAGRKGTDGTDISAVVIHDIYYYSGTPHIDFTDSNADVYFTYNSQNQQWQYGNGSSLIGRARSVVLTITGGNDVTTNSLISWLEANAKQVVITNLTNTKWVFDYDEPYYLRGSARYTGTNTLAEKNITFVSNDTVYNNIKYINSNVYDASELYYENTHVFTNEDDEYVSWNNSAYQTIEITGGNDVTDQTLIRWLTKNATSFIPDMIVDLTQLGLTVGTTYTIYASASASGYIESPVSNSVSYTAVYGISCTLSHLTVEPSSASTIAPNGMASLTLIADTGYTVPATSAGVTISGATIRRYDTQYGTPNVCVITLSNPTSNVTLSVNAIKKLETPNVNIELRSWPAYAPNDTLNIYVNDEDATRYKVRIQNGPLVIRQVTVPRFKVTLTFDEISVGYKRGIYVYDGQSNAGTLLYSSTTSGATPNTTVACATGYLYIYIDAAHITGAYSSNPEGLEVLFPTHQGYGEDHYLLHILQNNASVTLRPDYYAD